MKIYTIGHGKKTAEAFFELLLQTGIKQLIDVRLKNTSQLAGFAKKDDLEYFLQKTGGILYRHEPLLTPTVEMLDAFKKHKGSWKEYESSYLKLIQKRRIEEKLNSALFQKPTVLLCSCPSHEQCHRKVVVEYLASKWKNVEIIHI